MYKVVKKFNNICEKYKHQQNFDNYFLIKGAFPLGRRKEKIGVTYSQKQATKTT